MEQERGGKRRQVDQMRKEDLEADDHDQRESDPGTWAVEPEAVKARRKVHARRHGQAPTSADEPNAVAAVAAAEMSGKQAAPLTGIVPTAPVASTNPFAGIQLTAPSAIAANGDKPDSSQVAAVVQPANNNSCLDKANAATTSDAAVIAAPTSLARDAQPPVSAGTDSVSVSPSVGASAAAGDKDQSAAVGSAGGFSGLATGGQNPFAMLGGKPFGGFGGSDGGGFGALAASGTTFGGFGGGSVASTVPSGSGATTAVAPFGGAFGSNPFSFGTSVFPSVAAAPLQAASALVGAGGSSAGGAGDDEGDGAEGDDGGVVLFDGTGPKPIVQLPEQAKVTGEEDDENLFQADGTLFEFDSQTNKWHERCKGAFKVNRKTASNGTRQARMVMRQAANLRLVLNAKVYEGMPISYMPGKAGVSFAVVNAAAASNSIPSEGGLGTGTDGADASQPKSHTAAADVSGAPAAAKTTTMAVRIKSTETVSTLHDLLVSLKAPSAASGADGGGVDNGTSAAPESGDAAV